jgi:hypothetical protein
MKTSEVYTCYLALSDDLTLRAVIASGSEAISDSAWRLLRRERLRLAMTLELRKVSDDLPGRLSSLACGNVKTSEVSALPARGLTMPTHQHALPTHQHALPTHQHALPTHQHTMPTRQHALPTRQHALPTHQHTMPTRQHTMPTRQHALPTHQHTMRGVKFIIRIE